MQLKEFAHVQVCELLNRLNGELSNVTQKGGAESVHRLRVSIRRLTQVLRALRSLYSKPARKRIRRITRSLMDAAAEIRNRDIAMALCADAGVAEDAPSSVQLVKERKNAIRRLLQLAARWQKQAPDWNAILAMDGKHRKDAHWQPDQDVAANARRELPNFAEEYFAEGRKAVRKGLPMRKLHRFRLLTKHFRYLLEIFRPLYRTRFETRLKALRRIQTLLGQINDCEVTSQMMVRSKELEPLFKHLAREKKKYVAEFRRVWKQEFDAAGEEIRWFRYLSRPAKMKPGLSSAPAS